MKRLIVNFFSDFAFPGGIPVHQGELASWLIKKYNCEVRICIPWPLRYDMECNKEIFCNADRLGKLTELYAPLANIRKIDSPDTLRRIAEEADINHFHGSFTTSRSFLGEAIAASRNIKTNLYTFHSEAANPKCGSDVEEIRKRLNSVSTILAVSNRVRRNVLKIVPDREVYVVSNGFCELTEKFTRQNSIFTVLFIGRLNQTKGIESVISFAKSIHQKRIRLIIAGNAEFDSVYNTQVAQLAAENPNVVWLPKPLGHKDVLKLYAESDVFFFPSMMEGFPLVVIDSMKNGVVPVTSFVGGMEEIIKQGENGFLEEYYEHELYQKHIIELYENPTLLTKMKENVLNTPLVSWEDVSDKVYTQYLGLLHD